MKKGLLLIIAIGMIGLTGCNKKAETPVTDIPAAEIPAVSEKQANTCDKACENYALCASYGDDVTAQDVDDAYATCMEECMGWEQENITCMAKAVIRQPGDCLTVTMCGLKQYQGMMEGVEFSD